MDPADGPEALIRHLCHSSHLNESQARHLVAEVLAYFDEASGDFVRRRHRELQQLGLDNASIYRRISVELGRRRFPAPALSERQIRRLIYG